MVALKQWGQYSRSTERMVLEHGRLGRPERFFAGFAQVAFPQEMQLAQNLQKRGRRGSASARTGLLPHGDTCPAALSETSVWVVGLSGGQSLVAKLALVTAYVALP